MNEQTHGLDAAIQLLMDTGAASRPMLQPPGTTVPLALIPAGYKVESLKAHVPPDHIDAVVKLNTPRSFVDYVNRFKNPDTTVFANVTDTGAAFMAYIDYHNPEKAKYCSHTAVLACDHTTEWKRWMSANGQIMDQVKFATWLEDNQDLITNPPGAELLELVCNLEGKNAVKFSSSTRLNNGKNQLIYEEDVELRGAITTQAGKLEIPQLIVAAIAPFHGLSKYEVKARLKHRIEGRKLSFLFETVAPHRIVRDAVDGIVAFIAESAQIIPLMGAKAT